MKIIELEFEVGEGFPINIDQELCGFGISFSEPMYDCEVPSEDALKELINEVKEVMKDLHIGQSSYFILKLENWVQRFSNNVSSNGVSLLRLPVRISKDKITIKCRQDSHELYHELMHIKDVLCGRFPSIGISKEKQMACFLALINLLWGFSIEGRLERMGKPHLEREEAIRLHKDRVLSELVSRKQAEKLCDELWGKKVTYEELKSIVQKLMHS